MEKLIQLNKVQVIVKTRKGSVTEEQRSTNKEIIEVDKEAELQMH